MIKTVRRAGRWLALAAALAVPGIAAAQDMRMPAYEARAWVDRITVNSPSIAGNLEQNKADRDVFVILPPSYATAKNRRYPVIYFLHGFMLSAEGFMGFGKFADSAHRSMLASKREAIVIVPDSNSRHGGSMYGNSPTVGDYEGFIARDLVAAIDRKYRTIAERRARGLTGHSMGGHGTLKIAMKHPEVFSSVFAMSSCCLSARTVDPATNRKLETMTLDQMSKADFGTRAGLASMAAWSPAPEKAPTFFDVGSTDGKPDPAVLAKWAANAPLAMLPQYLPGLKSLTALGLEVGDKDFLIADNKAMHAELTRYGVKHDWEIFEGDHANRLAARFESHALPFFAKHLAVK